MDFNYSIIIQWSAKKDCFIALLPEWNNFTVEGESYEAALTNARQAIASLIESFNEREQTLPEVKIFQTPSPVSK